MCEVGGGRPFVLVLLALASACATSPVTGQREFTLMTEAQEIAMGRESDTQVKSEMGVYNDSELQQYVSRVGRSLAKLSEHPNLLRQFTVVDQAAINAYPESLRRVAEIQPTVQELKAGRTSFVIDHDSLLRRVAGLASPDLFRQADSSFLGGIRSFRPLTPAEAEAIQPNSQPQPGMRIKIVVGG